MRTGNALDLVRDLSARGFFVRHVGEELRVQPKDRLTAELREEILQRKAELLALLQGRCSQCLDLEQSGQVIILICGACGWTHAKVRVLVALEDHGTVTAQDIATNTGLDRRVVYAQLGRLYDLGMVATDLDGRFWISEARQ